MPLSLFQIFDKFLPRLQDPNSKVNLFALTVMLQIVPVLSDSLTQVLSMAIGNIAPNLSSKNKEIYNTAMEIINSLTENIGKIDFICHLYDQLEIWKQFHNV